MPKIPIWGWIAIAIGAFLLLRPRVALGQGAARPSGHLGQVDMGSHAVPKVPGGSVFATVAMTGLTKNSAGTGIAWPYRLRAVIQQGSTFSWEIIAGLATSPYNMPESLTLSFGIPAITPAGLYSVTVFLQAPVSDATGNPTATVVDIPGAVLTHPNAISVGTGVGPAVPAGSIGSVDVSQALVRAAQAFF